MYWNNKCSLFKGNFPFGNMRRYYDAISYKIKVFCMKRRMGLSKCKRGSSCMFIHTRIKLNLIQNKMRAGGWIIIHRICNTNRRIGWTHISDFSQHLEFPAESHKRRNRINKCKQNLRHIHLKRNRTVLKYQWVILISNITKHLL